jgi:hypothetical protein
LFWNQWEGTFETRYHHLVGGDILANAADNFDILRLYWWLVANCVSCGMEDADNTVEHLEMAAVEVGNLTHAADGIDCFLSTIGCLSQWQFVNNFATILNCIHGHVACHIGYLVEQYSLCSGEICSLTWFVNDEGREQQDMQDVILNELHDGSDHDR